jgi:hypothetical protein
MRVIVAVYTVPAANAEAAGDHEIVAVYSVVSATAEVGAEPVTGTVTPEISDISIMLFGTEGKPL